MRRQNEILSALYETTLGLMRRLDLSDLLTTIAHRGAHLMDASYGWLYLVDPKTNTLEAQVGSDIYEEHVGDRLRPGEGLAGQVWQQARPIAVENYSTWPGRAAKFDRQVIYAAVGVPLVLDDQVVGVLGVSQAEVRTPFDEDAIAHLTRFGQLAATAIDNARLYTAAQRHAQELALLNQVRSALASELDLSVLFRTIVEAIAQTFGYTQVSLYLLQGDTLYLQHQVGYDRVIAEIPITQGVTGRVARTGKPELLADVASDSTFLPAIGGITSEICLPLSDRGQIVGILNVESTQDVRLDEADLNLLLAVSEQVNVAIGRARLYHAAQESEQKYRSVVENVQEVIFQVDRDGYWTFLNPVWSKLTGFSVAESLGKFFLDFIHPDDRVAQTHQFREWVAQKQTGFQGELRYVSAGGGVRWVEARAQFTYDANYNFIGAFGALNDVTERKLAEEELQHQRDFAQQVMTSLAQGVTVTDLTGCLEYVNPAFARMLGYAPEALIGRQFSEFIVGEDLEAIKRQSVSPTSSYETRLQRADGSVLYALITDAPRLHDNDVIGAIAAITDLTERKRMEEALAQTRDQALEASRLKSEFLATMSHEIRTPMNSIIGMNELLLDSGLNTEQQELALGADDAAHALLAIIDDILDFSKIEAGKLILDEADFDLRVMIYKAIGLLAAKARAKGLDLRVLIAPDAPRWARGDPLRLRQILVNLIGNAVKFTARGEIVVEVALEATTDTEAILYFGVSDTGIGLSETAKRRLFQPFTQADGSMTRKYGGTGLGLAISKRLVEMMGGEIGAEGEDGRGSIFWFTVHLGHTTGLLKSGEPSATGTRVPASSHANILLAEDDPINQRLAVLQLEKLGYTVTTVSDGVAALATYTNTPEAYDLILMDCQMPKMNGFEATHAIREREADGLRHAPIVAMTASALPGDREACLAAGMDDYISKPVRWEELHKTLARWLGAGGPKLAAQPQSEPQPGENNVAEKEEKDRSPLDQATLRSLRRLAAPDNPEALIELIRTFLDSTAERLGLLRTGIKSGDATQTRQIAHSLKGSTGSFGAQRMSVLLGQLEALGKEGRLDGALALLTEVEAEFDRVKDAFEQELHTVGPQA